MGAIALRRRDRDGVLKPRQRRIFPSELSKLIRKQL